MFYDADGLETILAGGRYTLQLLSDGKRADNGLFVENGEQVACPGIRSTMRIGGRTATQTVPLSCLTDLDVKASKLRAAAVHYVIDDKLTTVGTGEDETYDETAKISIASDTTSSTRRLPFTRQR